jgi:hypothetical protein
VVVVVVGICRGRVVFDLVVVLCGGFHSSPLFNLVHLFLFLTWTLLLLDLYAYLYGYQDLTQFWEMVFWGFGMCCTEKSLGQDTPGLGMGVLSCYFMISFFHVYSGTLPRVIVTTAGGMTY